LVDIDESHSFSLRAMKKNDLNVKTSNQDFLAVDYRRNSSLSNYSKKDDIKRSRDLKSAKLNISA
jgi:hypothetical protein